MNYELANTVANEIEVAAWAGDDPLFSPTRTANKPDLFDMGLFIKTTHDVDGTCGTAACIAGWTLAHVHGTHDATRQRRPGYTAQRLLDLNSAEADVLFCASGTDLEQEIGDIDPVMAATAIRRATAQHKDTGTFDGSIWD